MVLSSSQTEMAVEVLNSLGFELIIFGVTLLCAFVLRVVFPKAETALKGKGKDFECKAASPVPTEKAPQKVRKAKLPEDDKQNSEQFCSKDGATTSLFCETMHGIKDWQNGNVRAANRTVALYLELRRTLKENGQKMCELYGIKHRPVDLYSGIIQIVIRSGKHQQVEAVLEDMTAQGVARTISFYESVMKQLAGQKLFRLALRVYDLLQADGLETSAVTYSCLVRFAAEVGDYRQAVEYFDRLSALTTPSIRAYMTILGVHSKRQDWNSTSATVKEMQARGIQLDTLTLNVALSTGVVADQVVAIEEMLRHAEKQKPFVPDVVSYNTLTKIYAQRAMGGEARSVLERMQEYGVKPNSITYNTVMDAEVRSGKTLEAWEHFQQLRTAGFTPDKFTCSILVKGVAKMTCYRQGVDASSTEAMVQKALDLLQEVDPKLDSNLRSNLYHSIAEAMVQAEQKQLLLKVIAQMRTCGVSTNLSLQRSMVRALRHDEREGA
eukprot:TRINITY_DN7644_c1_g1_i1.p1 TRINITY_DN7644_c1_g1~~TRINITY_DN7644_c1_g1_i1.p1  ORF type:complete len:495 (-),score=109.83 TRINITY_DN7644_c1_g1_i1:176-1660(-)